MNDRVSIDADSIVEDLIARFPSAAVVFVRRRMACVGCDIARFESIAEVCATYHQPVDPFLAELRVAAALGSRSR